MEQFLAFFEGMPPSQKLIWIMICMTLNFIIEGIRPLFTGGFRSWRHTRTNLALLGTTMFISIIFSALAVGIVQWTALEGIGLVHWVAMPAWLSLLATVMLFDLIAQYGVHYIMHNVPLLWNLHMVHHSDTHVDVTTGTRHHPIDFICREIFAAVALVVTGAPVAYYIFYRTLTIFFTYMTHANVQLPERLERVMSYVFVTPNMHKFHHHFEAPWTDRNYGNMLSIWDRLFGTYMEGDITEVKYGLDVADDSRGNDLAYQISLPFRTKERK